MREESEFRVRFKKTHAFVAAANTTTNSDWSITQETFNMLDVHSYMSGVQYEIKGAHLDDELRFQVVHPANGAILDEFGHVAAMDGVHILDEYLAKLYPNLLLRLSYLNTHASETVEIKCNLLRHIYTGK